MSLTEKCAKCGHEKLIARARVVCKADGADQDVRLRADAHPDAIVFKQASRSPVRASVCAKCGYVEFYAEDPGQLYDAYRESQE